MKIGRIYWKYVKTKVRLINTKSSSTRYYTHHSNAQVHTYDFFQLQ